MSCSQKTRLKEQFPVCSLWSFKHTLVISLYCSRDLIFSPNLCANRLWFVSASETVKFISTKELSSLFITSLFWGFIATTQSKDCEYIRVFHVLRCERHWLLRCIATDKNEKNNECLARIKRISHKNLYDNFKST